MGGGKGNFETVVRGRGGGCKQFSVRKRCGGEGRRRGNGSAGKVAGVDANALLYHGRRSADEDVGVDAAVVKVPVKEVTNTNNILNIRDPKGWIGNGKERRSLRPRQ